MFDDVTVHVGHPECAVRTFPHHHGPAPAVFAREEVEAAFAGEPRRGECHTLIGEAGVLHEIVEGFAHQRIGGRAVAAERTWVAYDHAATR